MAPFPHEFDPDAVLASARAVDGLEDFGREVFREPLGVLLEAYAGAPVHEVGAAILRSSVVRSLATRLRIEHWCAERPEIARERIEAPLVVVGMMRSGTDVRRRRPVHRYTPEAFGLRADRIREVFADYVARFVAPRDAVAQERP